MHALFSLALCLVFPLSASAATVTIGFLFPLSAMEEQALDRPVERVFYTPFSDRFGWILLFTYPSSDDDPPGSKRPSSRLRP